MVSPRSARGNGMRVRRTRRFSERLSLCRGRVGVTKVREAVSGGGLIGQGGPVAS